MVKRLSFLKRASLTLHKMAQTLFKIIEDKRTNLALAIDASKQSEILELADAIGPDLCVLKTHVDIIEDFTSDFGSKVRRLAEKHRFLIFEDRKFADASETVHLQYTKGIYKIADWAHLVNAHVFMGQSIIEALKNANLLLVSEIEAPKTLAKASYTKKAAEFAENYPSTVMGFICKKKVSQNPGMIHFTSNVKLDPQTVGPKDLSIEDAIIKNQSDIIIVGNDITNHSNPIKRTSLYKEKAWNAYVKNTK